MILQTPNRRRAGTEVNEDVADPTRRRDPSDPNRRRNPADPNRRRVSPGGHVRARLSDFATHHVKTHCLCSFNSRPSESMKKEVMLFIEPSSSCPLCLWMWNLETCPRSSRVGHGKGFLCEGVWKVHAASASLRRYCFTGSRCRLATQRGGCHGCTTGLHHIGCSLHIHLETMLRRRLECRDNHRSLRRGAGFDNLVANLHSICRGF